MLKRFVAYLIMDLITCQRTKDCWCRECHALRQDQYKDDNLERLKIKFVASNHKEQKALEAVFTQVLNCCAIAKSFKSKFCSFLLTMYSSSRRFLIFCL